MSLTKPYVTKQEIEQARQLDLLSYLQQHEPEELVRFSSNVYTLRSHDSLKISNGKWYQWSTGIGGISALDYLIKVQGMDFVSAVSKILSYSPLAEPAGPTPAKRQKPVFTLPALYENNDRVRTYLTGRGLSMDLLRMCIDAGLIYEDMRHNCVFVGFDRKKVPRYAMLRSSSQYSTFLGEVSGSDKRYSFSLSGSSETLYVFESAIDCLSFIELQRMKTDELKPDNYSLSSKIERCCICNIYLSNQHNYYRLYHIQHCPEGLYQGRNMFSRKTSFVQFKLPYQLRAVVGFCITRTGTPQQCLLWQLK